MLNIRKIELREVPLELKEPFRISSGIAYRRRILLIRVEDRDGFEGWGECVTGESPNYGPETIDTAWLIIPAEVGPRLLGRPFTHPGEVSAALAKDFRGHNMAKGAVEMACWELWARRQGQSLSRVLGGVRSRIQVGISVGIQASPEDLVQRVRRAVLEGYRKIKAKIKPGLDVAYIQAVRDALGDQVPLMADANNAYTLADLDVLKRLDGFGLVMIEQPLAWDDLLRHAELQRQLVTPICLDESIVSLDRAQDMVQLKAGRIVNIKPGRVAGHTASLAIHDFCQANGIPVWCGGMLESGIGRAHNVALASLPDFALPGDISPSSRYWAKDIVSPEWTMDAQGCIDVPVDRPGMGVEVDRDAVEDLTVRRMSREA